MLPLLKHTHNFDFDAATTIATTATVAGALAAVTAAADAAAADAAAAAAAVGCFLRETSWVLCRLAFSIASAHHLVAFLQAVAQAALHVEHGDGRLLWLSLHTLHLHMLATLLPVLEV